MLTYIAMRLEHLKNVAHNWLWEPYAVLQFNSDEWMGRIIPLRLLRLLEASANNLRALSDVRSCTFL